MILRLRNLPRGESNSKAQGANQSGKYEDAGDARPAAWRRKRVRAARRRRDARASRPSSDGLGAVDIPASIAVGATTYTGNVVSESTVVPFLDDTAVIGFLAIAFPCAVVFATIFAPRNA